MDSKYEFGHERLDVYRLAVDVARWAARQNFPTPRRHLQDQLLRAVDSMVLNLAEGCGHGPGAAGLRAAGRHHLRLALGSAAESHAVLDLIALPGGTARQQELRRIGAMLVRLIRGTAGRVTARPPAARPQPPARRASPPPAR